MLVAALMTAALALVLFAGLDPAHAQRAQKNANTAQQKKPATAKRVFVGAGSTSAGGTRQTIKSDNPLNDYSAYRSGDRFSVVIPNADANAISKGGAGRGYSDMQVQQRGNDVVLTYKLQPGAKPRVEQKFNRLDVVFETPGGAAANPAQSSANPATNNARPAAAQQQQQTATRDAQSTSPSSTANAAANRTQTPDAQSPNPSQHAAHQQQQQSPAPAASELQSAAPTDAAATNAATSAANATPEATQATTAATPGALEIAQAREPERTAPAAGTSAPTNAAAPSVSIGAALLRNWPLVLTAALLLVGLGLFFAARRTSAGVSTPPPVEVEARPAAVEEAAPAAIEEAKPTLVEEATPATTAEAIPATTTEAATPTAAQTSMPVVFVDAREPVKPQRDKQRGRKGKNKKGGKAKNKPEPPAVAARQQPPAAADEDATPATPIAVAPAAATLVAASALADAATEERAAETPAATPVEAAAPHAVEETTVAEPVAAETPVEEINAAETSLAEVPVAETAAAETTVTETPAEEAAAAAIAEETIVAETPVEETVAEATPVAETAPEVAAVEDTVVEVTADEVAAVEETVVEETAVEETVVESAAVEDVVVDEAAAGETVVDETLVEEATGVEPAVVEASSAEPSSGEPTFVGSSFVAPTAGEAVTGIEAAVPSAAAESGVSADAESVEAEVRRLLDGERYDRGVLKSADMMARQMVAAELLGALAGRSAERRARARTAFIEHGFFNESAHDLHYAEAPGARAAAARSLALVGDRAATSHLIAALEDDSVDVRRAAVEALANLRDPSAVGALEDLHERQKRHREKLPRRFLEHAIETCREGAAATPAVVAPAAVTVAAEPATEQSAAAEVAEETAAVEAVAEEPAVVEPPAFESSAAPATGIAPFGEIAGEPVASSVEEAVEQPPASAEDEAAVVEETEPVIEDAAAWFSVMPAGGVAVEETTVAGALEDTLVNETLPDTLVEKSVVPAEKLEAAAFFEDTLTGPAVEESGFAEPRVEETLAIEPLPDEGTTVTAVEQKGVEPKEVEPKEVEPVIEDTAAWFALVSSGGAAAVEETPVIESPVEETAIEARTAADESDARWSFGVPAAEETVAGDARFGEIEPRLYEPEAATVVEEREAPGAWSTESEAATLESFNMPTEVGAKALEPAGAAADSAHGASAEDWIELDVEETSFAPAPPAPPAPPSEAPPARVVEAQRYDAPTEIEARGQKPSAAAPSRFARESAAPPRAPAEEKGVELFDELSTVPRAIQQRITSADTSDRASALADLAHLDTDEAFHQICAAFDDDSREVRNAAARALFDLRPDRADSFTRALREAAPERRRNIGAAINSSGLAADAVGQLTGESREKTYEAFSLLFLMAKAGEVQPLLRAIESHPDSEVRLAVVKLLALSGQKEILPAFRRLAVRGSLPTEVRSAVMEAIYQISSQDAHSAA